MRGFTRFCSSFEVTGETLFYICLQNDIAWRAEACRAMLCKWEGWGACCHPREVPHSPHPILATSLTALLCLLGHNGTVPARKESRGKEKWRKGVGLEQGGQGCGHTRELPTWVGLQQGVVRSKWQRIHQRSWGLVIFCRLHARQNGVMADVSFIACLGSVRKTQVACRICLF